MAEQKGSKGIQMTELKGIIRMLSATAEKAEHLAMTGREDQGSAAGVRQYNAVLKRLGDVIPGDLFVPLEEDAALTDLGMCCSQLMAYLEGMVEEPAAEKKGKAVHGDNVIVNIGGDLKDLGEMVREAMPAWIKEKMGAKEPKEEEEPEAGMNHVESRIAELGAQMQVLAERMHREELSSDEIRRMADQMRELGQKQSELAKQHASVRSQVNETNG